MDLSLDQTQQLIQESARDFVRGVCPRDVLVNLDKDPASIGKTLWPKIAELGWMGMAIPEQYGGTGNSLTDIAVLYEELGTGPVPGAHFSSGVLCARVLMEAASEAQRKELLPKLAAGERVFALALTEPNYGWSTEHVRVSAAKDGTGFKLSGRKVYVHDAMLATDLLVVARSDAGITLLRVNATASGVSIRPLDGFLASLAEVTFENVRVASADVIGTAGSAWEPLQRALQAAIPVLCAYKVGGCKSVFEMSVQYSKDRLQFGQPIGRFQRVQDHVIHIVNYLDAARWTTYEALWKLDTAQDPASSVHMSKSVASEGYLRACDFAHEVHAGIGVMREYGLTLHTKMSRSLYHCLGAPKVHRKQLERVLGFEPRSST
jgi:alkylation response protein AidB-like acyl-CoA dehydrogenase